MTQRTPRPSPIFLILLTLITISLPADPPHPLAGHWSGAVNRLGAIQGVEFEFAERDGALVGTYAIPELGIFDEPATEIALDGDALSFRFIYGTFATVLDGGFGEIAGENPNWGPPVQIHLKRGVAPHRPFAREEVAFECAGRRVAATLYKPRGAGPFAAVVALHGASNPSRSHWIYRAKGPLFAAHGVACLVHERRDADAPEDAPPPAFADLAEDAAAAAASLRARADIRPDAVGYAGSSQGGWIALMADALPHGRADFHVLFSGPATSVAQQEIDRVAYTMRADDHGEADIAEAVAYTRLMLEVGTTGEGWDAYAAAAEIAKTKPWAEIVQFDESLEALTGWRRIAYDPAAALRATTVPVLAFFGAEDTLVPPAENVELMRSLLAEAGNTDVTVVVLPRAGHALTLDRQLVGDDWAWPRGRWIWSRRAPDLEPTLAAWLAAHGLTHVAR